MPVFTEVLPISSQPGASFQLPSTEDVKIMAVRVTVDNTGGTDTEPELAMLAPTGAVIATERQSEAIPAGDSGMASWALRLAKKAKARAGTSFAVASLLRPQDVFTGFNSYAFASLLTNAPGTFSLSGSALAIAQPGVYSFKVQFTVQSNPLSPAVASPWTKALYAAINGLPGGGQGLAQALASGIQLLATAGNQYWQSSQAYILDAPVAPAFPLAWDFDNSTGAQLLLVNGDLIVTRLSDAV